MKENGKRPVRVLHIINQFVVGGVETWLLNVVKNLPASGYQFDFFATSPGDADFDNEIISFGCKIFKVKKSRPSFFLMYSELKKVIRENGHYDVIHSHLQYSGGAIMLLGYMLGIPVRIAHSHNDTRAKKRHLGIRFLKYGYAGLMRGLIYLFATRGIGVSSAAAEDLFGPAWDKDKRWMILPCGA